MKKKEEIIKIIAEVLEVPVEEIKDDTAIGDIDSWDSLRQISIISALEEHFGFQFEPEAIMDMEDVSDIIMEVEKRI